MYNALLILLFISPLLLLATYIMTINMESFWKICIAHTIVFIAYMTLLMNYSKLLITAHDEYGLGQLALGFTIVIVHIIIGFIHGLYLWLNKSKNDL